MNDPGFRMLELKHEGYCCAQIIIILALEARGTGNQDLVRAMAGLCYGAGMSGEVCGCLSGGACLISLYGGKGREDEETDHAVPLMMSELVEWFREAVGGAQGGIRCDEILGRYPDKSLCGVLVAATFGEVCQILANHGYHLTTAPKGA